MRQWNLHAYCGSEGTTGSLLGESMMNSPLLCTNYLLTYLIHMHSQKLKFGLGGVVWGLKCQKLRLKTESGDSWEGAVSPYPPIKRQSCKLLRQDRGGALAAHMLVIKKPWKCNFTAQYGIFLELSGVHKHLCTPLPWLHLWIDVFSADLQYYSLYARWQHYNKRINSTEVCAFPGNWTSRLCNHQFKQKTLTFQSNIPNNNDSNEKHTQFKFWWLFPTSFNIKIFNNKPAITTETVH